jgi:hypothetical protein
VEKKAQLQTLEHGCVIAHFGETDSMSGRVRNRRRASPTAESKSESRSRSRSRSVSKRTRSRSKSKSRGGEIGEPKSPAPLLRVYEEGSSDFEEEANARKERLTYEQKRQKSYEARKKVLVSATSPIHVSCINSPLDSTMADSQNYRGLLNLAFIILFVSQVRLVIENLLKYGILFLQVPSLQVGSVCVCVCVCASVSIVHMCLRHMYMPRVFR